MHTESDDDTDDKPLAPPPPPPGTPSAPSSNRKHSSNKKGDKTLSSFAGRAGDQESESESGGATSTVPAGPANPPSDEHLGPNDDPWLGPFYATLPSLPYVFHLFLPARIHVLLIFKCFREIIFEKTAKNRLERSDDRLLSPHRMKEALEKLNGGPSLVK
jgi:hypothetical protein